MDSHTTFPFCQLRSRTIFLASMLTSQHCSTRRLVTYLTWPSLHSCLCQGSLWCLKDISRLDVRTAEDRRKSERLLPDMSLLQRFSGPSLTYLHLDMFLPQHWVRLPSRLTPCPTRSRRTVPASLFRGEERNDLTTSTSCLPCPCRMPSSTTAR